jgi:hypothetical protein
MATHYETLFILLAVAFSFFASVTPQQAAKNLQAWRDLFRS